MLEPSEFVHGHTVGALGLAIAERIIFVVLPCAGGHRIAQCTKGATKTEGCQEQPEQPVHFLLRGQPYVILCIIQMRAPCRPPSHKVRIHTNPNRARTDPVSCQTREYRELDHEHVPPATRTIGANTTSTYTTSSSAAAVHPLSTSDLSSALETPLSDVHIARYSPG